MEQQNMLEQAKALENLPEQKGSSYWKYHEQVEHDFPEIGVSKGDRVLHRLEKFLEVAPGLHSILNEKGKIQPLVDQLLGEPAILFKEKVNYKFPGGKGFDSHQDAAAGWWLYNQSLHISALIAIDNADEENGCLQIVRGQHKKGLLGPRWKGIPEDLVKSFNWEMAPTKPGAIVLFDSFVPHRSAPNTSKTRRRLLYVTYAKKSEGDHRSKYYEDKFKNLPPDADRNPNQTYAYKI
jgi:ectoine hydroxylase-related dioxygenase (phytanoyl-CoA dioxygenase family)